MIKFLPGIFDRLAAAWTTFWNWQPAERLPDVISPNEQILQPFRAHVGGELRTVRPIRAAFPGHLVVRSDDGQQMISAGIISRDAVLPLDKAKFDEALDKLFADNLWREN